MGNLQVPRLSISTMMHLSISDHGPGATPSSPENEFKICKRYHVALAENDMMKQAIALQQLGDLHCQKARDATIKDDVFNVDGTDDVLKSVAAYTAALVRTSHTDQRHSLTQRLRETEAMYIDLYKHSVFSRASLNMGVQAASSHHANPVDKYTRKMDKFREFIRKRLNKVQDMWKHKFVSQERGAGKGQDLEVLKESINLSNKVRQEMKTLFKDIVIDCVAKLGEPPCKYAIVGVGDIALNYATPFSDFQYVILTKSSDLEAKEYFKYLANLIYIQILLLGETPLTATLLKLIQDPFNRMIRNVMDEHTTHGIKIDISWTSTCINPFLFKYSKHIDECDQDVDLIKTPADMIRFVYLLHDKGLYKFALKMYQTMLIVGDNDLFVEYRDMVEDYFIPKQFSQEGRIQSDSANLLTEITGYFEIDFYVELNRNHTNMTLYNIAKDLKLTASLVFMLKIMFCLSGRTLIGISEEMRQNGYIGEDGEVELKTLIYISYYLHLRSFTQQNGQNLSKALLECKPDLEEMVNPVNVVFCDKMPGIFLRYYGILIPLLRGLRQFNTSDDKKSLLKMELQRNDSMLSYFGHTRLAQYKEALSTAKQFLREKDLSVLTAEEQFQMFNDLGLIALKCKNTKEANTFFTHAMEAKENIENEESKVYAFITTWHNMGLVHLMDERFSKATTFFEESLTMGQQMGGNQIFKSQRGRLFTIMVYTSIGMAKQEATSLQEAEKYQQKALDNIAKVRNPNMQIIWWQRNLAFDLANLKIQLGKFKESLGLLKVITEHDTSLSELHCPQFYFAATLHFITLVVKSMGKATLVDLYSMYSNRMITTVLGTTFADADLEPEAFSNCDVQDLLILLRLYRDITFRGDRKKCVRVSKLILNFHETSAYERVVPHVTAAWDHLKYSKILITMETYPEALESVKAALTLIEKPFGDSDNVMRALLLKNKGICLLNTDNPEDALKHFQMAYGAFQHALLKIKTPEQIEILEHIAEANKRLRIYDEAVKSWEECISLRKHIFGPVHLKVAYSLRKLGLLLQEMMEYDGAVTCIQQSLEMYKRVHGHGKNHKDVAQLHFDLGKLYCDILEPDKAEHSLVKSLEIRRFLLSANPHQKDMVDILVFLGNFYRTESRTDEAIALHKEAIESGLIVYGQKSKHLAKMYACLGEDHQAQENYEESSKSFETAVDIFRSDVGIENENLEVANWLRELGRAYEVLGIRDKASQCHKRSLEIKELHMGKEAADADLLDSLSRLAERHESKGDCKRAIPLRKQFLLKQKQISGDEPSTAKCGALKALSRNYLRIGEHEYAQGYNSQLLQMLREMHSDNVPNPEVAAAVHNAGFIYDTMGRVPKAIKLYSEALKMYQALDGTGEFKELIGTTMTDLGNSMNIAGQQEAVDVLQSSVDILESLNLVGERKLLLAKAIYCLGVAYEVHPKYEMAVKNHKLALAIRQELDANQEGLLLAESLRALGRSYCQLSRYPKGIPLLEKSYLHVKSIHEEEKRVVIDDAHALVELGQAHAASGNAEEAITKYTQALEIMREVYGKEKAHLQVANCLSLMAEAAKSTKERQKAIDLAHQSMNMYKVVLRHVHDHPIYPHLTALIAEVHMSRGQYADAVAFYTKASQLYLSLHQGNALTLDVQRNMSKLREAKKMLQLSTEMTTKKGLVRAK